MHAIEKLFYQLVDTTLSPDMVLANTEDLVNVIYRADQHQTIFPKMPGIKLEFTEEWLKKQKAHYGINYRPELLAMDEANHWLKPELFNEITLNILKNRLQDPILVFSRVTAQTLRKLVLGEANRKQFLKDYSSTPWFSDICPEEICLPIYRVSGIPDWPTSLTDSYARYIRQQNRPMELASHNTKATDHFKFKYGTNPAYKIALGVELELENYTEKASKVLQETLKEHAIFKRDGSLNRGVEICTAPASLDQHKLGFQKFFNLKKESGLKVENNCGLHIHVDRKAIEHQTHLAKIMLFMNNTHNNTFIEKLAGRKANNYCQRAEETWETMITKKETSKYYRVNLAPKTTIEFRLFASTLDEKQFHRCLEFVQAVIDYTRTGAHNCSIKDIVKKEEFYKYINKNKQFYPELVTYINPKKNKEPTSKWSV